MQKICVIIPCYNEGLRFNIEAYNQFLNTHQELDMCFVNDGSSDNTLDLLNQLQTRFNTVSVMNLEKNVGKAEAIRYAVLSISAENYKYLGYLDADLSTSLDEMLRISTFTSESAKFILGSRIKTLNTSIKRNPLRHILGRALATIVNTLILKLPIYDTQCGAKIIKTSLAKDIFKQPFVSKWLFDIELLLRINKLKGSQFCKQYILEVPLKKWHDNGNTRITFTDFIFIPIDLLKIYFQYQK
ncbi:glycosyltransferase [Xanthomarina sp. F2636L]|uniref:glycosyltransferase n=1 Tax=Xanthomarina sp. F2636L TaxID=2996018 RepID=UPI00225E4EC1|nr:glycosyltransferase [Xanthomarina sp. F2636L]MCX7550561.1 glycosyltransferase [Xanthomarina sp. F2636L]